jgi:hypothetical protein
MECINTLFLFSFPMLHTCTCVEVFRPLGADLKHVHEKWERARRKGGRGGSKIEKGAVNQKPPEV